ncbi:parallel beta-helix domain-containing protein [Pseudobacteriovorax antillogorgiicola]|uniref:Parallel beta-helix repeat-containing protein n=1 Tax=Pseudobacteriovorax antillogorgiicola TaxID=1513793 RepID=A0A1Y6CPS7_9BACT|nr:parallel beta-helix domain-containing protein [Pseudobacteriovorax antillogorgiicola]TCS43632.1 parallel beta-helix repeat protein [Pseudobacteriovorax antillogorgiicola]SMF79989.1 parallel beta-helix repeat-containing protein [Pseudobacteriovorax antillogorgiicola]
MKFWIAGVILGALSFTGGMFYQKSRQSEPAAPLQEASYHGGFQAGKASKDQNLRAVPEDSSPRATHDVRNGQSIMAAIKQAQPGDTVRVFPGTYTETVYIDKDNIRLQGVIQKGQWPELNGEKRLNDAILYSGNNIIVENFRITKYKGNGIMGQAGNNFEIRNNIIVDTGVYGIFPQLGTNGIVEYNVLSGIEDAAIYVGMSDHIHVAHNEVFDNVAGIEIENSRHAIVENNMVYNNTGGILVFITPGLPIKTTYDVIVRNNFVTRNNHKNFGAPGSTVAGIPAGTGILVMAADEVIIENNIITHNKTAGILITDHGHASNITVDEESEPNADKIMILSNLMEHNGYDTISDVKALLLTEFKSGNPDIVRVGPSRDSCINYKDRYITVGVDSFPSCSFTNTDSIKTYLLDTPAPPRIIDKTNQGKLTYLGICTGCHSYTGRLIGPPVEKIQSLYRNNPKALADFIARPYKKRPDYPEMPPQDYLSEEVRLAVAEYLLKLEN